jgi:putative ABC transport system permease protein
MMRAWMIIRFALGGLRRTPLRVALTSLGVAIASGALVSMVGFALGIQNQVETPFQKLGLLNNVEVKPKRADDSQPAAILDDAALEQMRAIPGVVLAYPEFRVAEIDVVFQDKSQSGLALGLPREAALLGIVEEILVAGEFFSLGDAPEAILGERLAQKLGFPSPEEAIGSVVTLEAGGLTSDGSETFTFQRRKFEVTVVGVYSLPQLGPRFAAHGVVLPVELMKEVPGIRFAPALEKIRKGESGVEEGYPRATVRVEKPSSLDSVEEKIQDLGFKTRTLLSRLEEMRTFFVFMDVLLASVGTVALVVAGLGIVNTLLMSVLERYQEIGICKAIGASSGDLLLLFLTEAAIIGLLGGLGGLLLGRVVSWGLEMAVNAYAQGQGVSAHLALFAFPGWLLLATIGFAVAISIVAGVYPAVRAARVDPILALRRD